MLTAELSMAKKKRPSCRNSAVALQQPTEEIVDAPQQVANGEATEEALHEIIGQVHPQEPSEEATNHASDETTEEATEEAPQEVIDLHPKDIHSS